MAVTSEGLSVLDAIMVVITRTYPFADQTTDIFGSGGLADSMAFLDVVLEVEERTGMVFNPDSLELDGAISPTRMASAFKAHE